MLCTSAEAKWSRLAKRLMSPMSPSSRAAPDGPMPCSCCKVLDEHRFPWCRQLRTSTPLLPAADVVAPQLADRRGEAYVLDSVGYIHHGRGNYAEAAKHYEQAGTFFRDLGIRSSEARTLTRLGATYEEAGDHDSAAAAWHRAFDVLDNLDHRSASAVRRRLGTVHAARSGP